MADREADLEQEYVTWNHSIAEVINGLIQHDLLILGLQEFDDSPYNCFSDMEEFSPGKFRVRHLENKLPMLYSVKAQKFS